TQVDAAQHRDLLTGSAIGLGQVANAQHDWVANCHAKRMRSSQRLLIFQHELVDRYHRTKHDDIPRIFGVTQEIRFGHELEAGRLDFLAHHTSLDPMERLAFARAIAGTPGTVGYD